MNKTQFGFCIPLFANPGMLFFRTPNYKKLDWGSIKETTLLCEELGYDSLFVADHMFLGRNGEMWECISAMSALLAITKRMWVYPIHLCNNFRTPSVVAKAFATMSHISGGRVGMFYDYGWRKAEFDQYGVEFGSSDEDRIEQMTEGIKIIKGMFEEERFSFSGKHYSVTEAIAAPMPLQKIPIWMGEANNSLMVKTIVEVADVFNSMPCSLETFQKKLDTLREECENQGRDFQSLGLSLETQILIRETEEEVDAELEKYRKMIEHNNSLDDDILTQLKTTATSDTNYNSNESLKKEFMIGTPDHIWGLINGFKKKGVEHFMLWFMDYPQTKSIELFAKEIIHA